MPVDPEWWLDDQHRDSLTHEQLEAIIAATTQYNIDEATRKQQAAEEVLAALNPDPPSLKKPQ